jgi:serine phosphatase RsbU (regulator of sigma subunit)
MLSPDGGETLQVIGQTISHYRATDKLGSDGMGVVYKAEDTLTKFAEQFAAEFTSVESRILSDIRDFVDWQTQGQGSTFIPKTDDDVAIRSYLLHLRLSRANRSILQRRIASLKRFYDWAQSTHLIAKTPFDSFDFSRPLLSREQIKRRQETCFANPIDREIAHLRALNHLAEHLNRSADINTLLGTVVETLVQVMGLKTAWAFLWTEAGLYTTTGASDPPHDFPLAACCGLPPALEKDNQHYLCVGPDCHCQHLLRNGQLVRAVNIVECTRLQYACRHAGDTQGLLFHATVPIISQKRPLGLINIATDQWEFLTSTDLQFLSAAGAQVAIALERARLYDLAETQRIRLEQELEMARAVQKSLLPTQPPRIPGFTLAADWRPVREVGGDFYDFFPLPDGRWGLLLADVSGKGAPAALYMALTRSLIRSEASRHANPSAVLTEVNRRLLVEAPNELFVTVFYAVLDPVSCSLKYANAGHDPPFLRHASCVQRLALGGLIMGLFEELALNDETLNLESGDTLVAYTDGLTDTVNHQDEAYGHTRLAGTINNAPASAQDILTYILKDLGAFAGPIPQPDDITLLILTTD